jgi:hypothetical protein
MHYAISYELATARIARLRRIGHKRRQRAWCCCGNS